MFIKLTKCDGRPIWLNASFIVTVEPRRDGNGAVVVPIGDGLDYDVRETPEAVLALLEGAPEPAVVPVSVSDCLTKTPADVSPEPEPRREEPPSAAPAAQPAAPAEKKPRKRAARARTKAPDEKAPDERAPAPALEISPDQVARLAKLAPKSVGKLKNTLATQFHVADVGVVVAALEAKGAFALEGNRVVWPASAEEK